MADLLISRTDALSQILEGQTLSLPELPDAVLVIISRRHATSLAFPPRYP
jgi:hypothetical protein